MKSKFLVYKICTDHIMMTSLNVIICQIGTTGASSNSILCLDADVFG